MERKTEVRFAVSIAVDCRMWKHTGIGVYLRNIVSRLPHLLDAHMVLLGDVEQLAAAGLPQSVEIVPCLAPIYSVREQWELLRALPADVELFWSPHYNAPLFYRGPLLVTIHDICHVVMGSWKAAPHKQIYAQAFFRVLRHRARVTTVSEFTKSELVRFFAYDPLQIQVVSDGVAPSFFEVKKDVPPAAPPYFISVGNAKPHKNCMGLVHAFSALAAEIPHTLVFVGPMNYEFRQEVELAAGNWVAEGRIRFEGRVSFDRLQTLVANAIALVFPSLYEGFGLPPLEAMACGCPVVAARATSIPEVCGDAALYFDPFDIGDIFGAMKRMAQEDKLRANLVAQGRERARMFSWDASATKMADIMQRELAGRHS